MAQVNVIGRITADLELKTSEKSNPYVRFDIAENIGSRQTLHTQYFQVCAWGEDANRLMKAHAKKGSLIGLRQFIPDGDKPDHIVPVTVSTPCLLRYALVGGFHADNAILIARIIEDRPVISPDIPHGSPLLSRFLSVHRFSSAPSFLPFMPPRHICALHRSGGFPIPSHNPRKYRDVVLSAVSALLCRCRAFS